MNAPGQALEIRPRAPFIARARGALRAWLERQEKIPLIGGLFAYAHSHLRQLVRFVLIGAVLAVFNLLVLFALRSGLHLSNPVAITIMYVIGAIAHFSSHRWITYAAQDEPLPPQGLRYAVMLVWNFIIMQTVVALATAVSISPYLGVMASTALTMVSNFLIMTHIVFTKERA
jgi:putative flippase GtrA